MVKPTSFRQAHDLLGVVIPAILCNVDVPGVPFVVHELLNDVGNHLYAHMTARLRQDVPPVFRRKHLLNLKYMLTTTDRMNLIMPRTAVEEIFVGTSLLGHGTLYLR